MKSGTKFRKKLLINVLTHVFKPRRRRVTEVEGGHIKRYCLVIIHLIISQYVFVKFGLILIKKRKVNTISVNILYLVTFITVLIRNTVMVSLTKTLEIKNEKIWQQKRHSVHV